MLDNYLWEWLAKCQPDNHVVQSIYEAPGMRPSEYVHYEASTQDAGKLNECSPLTINLAREIQI